LIISKERLRLEWGKTAKCLELEESVIAWVCKKRSEGHVISMLALRLKARSITDTGIGDFKASTSWVYRFMNHHELLVRRSTHIAKHLPDDMSDKTMILSTIHLT